MGNTHIIAQNIVPIAPTNSLNQAKMKKPIHIPTIIRVGIISAISPESPSEASPCIPNTKINIKLKPEPSIRAVHWKIRALNRSDFKIAIIIITKI